MLLPWIGCGRCLMMRRGGWQPGNPNQTQAPALDHPGRIILLPQPRKHHRNLNSQNLRSMLGDVQLIGAKAGRRHAVGNVC